MWWWLLVLLAVVVIVWMNSWGMSSRDRISIAFDLLTSSNFQVADGFEAARLEDPDLVGWIQDGKNCIMLFRSQHGPHIKEVVDVVSDTFHPGLVVHLEDGRAVRTDASELLDDKLIASAERLAEKVRHTMRRLQPAQEYDGVHL